MEFASGLVRSQKSVSQDFSLTELHGRHDLPVLSACKPLRSASDLEYFWQLLISGSHLPSDLVKDPFRDDDRSEDLQILFLCRISSILFAHAERLSWQ
jgi:hypothetical protein